MGKAPLKILTDVLKTKDTPVHLLLLGNMSTKKENIGAANNEVLIYIAIKANDFNNNVPDSIIATHGMVSITDEIEPQHKILLAENKSLITPSIGRVNIIKPIPSVKITDGIMPFCSLGK